jgi:hypothetical protein
LVCPQAFDPHAVTVPAARTGVKSVNRRKLNAMKVQENSFLFIMTWRGCALQESASSDEEKGFIDAATSGIRQVYPIV